MEEMSSHIPIALEHLEGALEALSVGIRYGNFDRIRVEFEKLKVCSAWLKSVLSEEFVEENFGDFNRHLDYIGYHLEKANLMWIKHNLEDIRLRDYPSIRSKIYVQGLRVFSEKEVPLSREVFIVHGHDFQSLEELKEMVRKLGLEPIVLHEKASGGLTLAEKLERYSENIGFAFVILTPDDIGCQAREIEEVESELRGSKKKLYLDKTLLMTPPLDLRTWLGLKSRARQNVIFELGYFWGLLRRKRVCCLLKGDVEKPSDIEGIVYIPFKESVNECRSKIVKELRDAGYELRT